MGTNLVSVCSAKAKIASGLLNTPIYRGIDKYFLKKLKLHNFKCEACASFFSWGYCKTCEGTGNWENCIPIYTNEALLQAFAWSKTMYPHCRGDHFGYLEALYKALASRRRMAARESPALCRLQRQVNR